MASEEHPGNCRSAAVVLGPSGMGPWQQREHHLALDRQARDESFGVIPVPLPDADPALGLLSLNTWVDLRSGRFVLHAATIAPAILNLGSRAVIIQCCLAWR